MDMIADPPFLDCNASASQPDAAIDQALAIQYWNSVSSDNNGMLGGYPQTSRIDIQGSSNFLAKLRRKQRGNAERTLPPLTRVADCGAGIGRITKGFLRNVSQSVDVVEPVKKFTDELVENLAKEENVGQGVVGKVINLGLQDWTPEQGAYDIIWNQWCLGHLTDVQLVAYLRRCKDGLRRDDACADGQVNKEAWIVVKENMSSDPKGKDIYDEEDSSVTRTDDKFQKLFKQAGLKIVATELQRGFPKELFPVRIYALKPE